MCGTPAFTWRVAAVAVVVSAAAARAAEPFEIVVLTDTEYVVDHNNTAWWPIFPAQTQWIVDNRTQENIVFVSHVGDAPHHPTIYPDEWDRVTDAMYRLDGLVPYAISPGNHDLEDKPGFAQRFGPAHLGGFDWFGGATADGLNSWQTFSAGGYEFLHIALAKGPSASTLTWARNVIAAKPRQADPPHHARLPRRRRPDLRRPGHMGRPGQGLPAGLHDPQRP